jgi:hypothetical protein
VDHKKTLVVELDPHDLQRHPIRIVTEKDDPRVAIPTGARCLLVERQDAMFDDVA